MSQEKKGLVPPKKGIKGKQLTPRLLPKYNWKKKRLHPIKQLGRKKTNPLKRARNLESYPYKKRQATTHNKRAVNG